MHFLVHSARKVKCVMKPEVIDENTIFPSRCKGAIYSQKRQYRGVMYLFHCGAGVNGNPTVLLNYPLLAVSRTFFVLFG